MLNRFQGLVTQKEICITKKLIICLTAFSLRAVFLLNILFVVKLFFYLPLRKIPINMRQQKLKQWG